LLATIADAVQFAHQRGILHRDLKPQNVMIDRQGNVIIMDFGLARAIDDYSAKTRTDGGIESPLYMSPEQMERRPLHHQSDIFSLGLIYYFLLSGKHFFRGKTASSIVKHMRTLPFREAVASSGVPAAAVPILQRMLERDPELRAKDLGEIVTAVKDALHGHIAVPNLTDLSATAARTRQEDPVDRVRRTRERLRGLLERVDSAS
jgi:serine/threonine-protein kinase